MSYGLYVFKSYYVFWDICHRIFDAIFAFRVFMVKAVSTKNTILSSIVKINWQPSRQRHCCPSLSHADVLSYPSIAQCKILVCGTWSRFTDWWYLVNFRHEKNVTSLKRDLARLLCVTLDPKYIGIFMPWNCKLCTFFWYWRIRLYIAVTLTTYASLPDAKRCFGVLDGMQKVLIKCW